MYDTLERGAQNAPVMPRLSTAMVVLAWAVVNAGQEQACGSGQALAELVLQASDPELPDHGRAA